MDKKELTMHGWTGKILDVDLNTGKISRVDTRVYSEKYLGGRGIASRIYWERVKPETDAFDPLNHLILMTGPTGSGKSTTLAAMIDHNRSRLVVPSNPDLLHPGQIIELPAPT